MLVRSGDTVSFFQTSLIFAGNNEALKSGAPHSAISMGRLVRFPWNIRLVWKNGHGKNALAYFGPPSVTKKKIFLKLAPAFPDLMTLDVGEKTGASLR